MKHFIPTPETLEELKKAYHKLAIKFHPDSPAGSTEKMKEVNTEYDTLFGELKNTHLNSKGEKYTSKSDNQETPEMFKDIISKIIHLENIHIEIIGSFIWITGNTRPYRDIFKALNFRWHSNKVAWYLAPEWYKKHNNKIFTLDEVRDMFGTQDVESKVAKKVNMS